MYTGTDFNLRHTTVTVNGVSKDATEDFSAGFVEGKNDVHFASTSANGSGNLVITYQGDLAFEDSGGNVNGLQIRPIIDGVPGVPEPGSAVVGMLVLGVCGASILVRRRAIAG